MKRRKKEKGMLAELRGLLGFTQEEMAVYLELRRSYYAHIEAGNKTGSTAAACRVAELLLRMAPLRNVSQEPSRPLRIEQEKERRDYLRHRQTGITLELYGYRKQLETKEKMQAGILSALDRLSEPLPNGGDSIAPFEPFFRHALDSLNFRLKNANLVEIARIRLEIIAREAQLVSIEKELSLPMPEFSGPASDEITPLSVEATELRMSLAKHMATKTRTKIRKKNRR